MEQQFWQEKWDSNEIGFHQDQPHPLLLKHFGALELPAGSHVFVPLCGKSKDMLAIRDMGNRVSGLELSAVAVESFFDENNIDYERQEHGQYQLNQAGDLQVLCGDFFSLDSKTIEGIDAVFDRASLIAMPPEMRTSYAARMRSLLNSGVKILLIALEYEEGLIKAPPFAVKEEEIKRLYGDWCNIELLEKAASEVKARPVMSLLTG